MRQKNLEIGAIAYNKFDLDSKSSSSLVQLLDKVEMLGEPMSFEELINEVMEASRHIMDAEASSLMLLDEESGELCVSLSTGPVKEEIRGKAIPRDKGFGGWVAQHKIPLIVNDVTENSELFWGELSDNFETRNLICAPLIDKDQNVIGVIQAVNRNGPDGFEENDMPVFQTLARHAARAIEKHRSQEQVDIQLQEKDLFLSELHHRMKNNLALISGMIEMEEANVKDTSARETLKKVLSRIKSVNAVYELLSDKGDFNNIELESYLKKLVEGITESLSSPDRDIKIEVNIDEISLHPEKTLTCGLIINELLVNSYKHAFRYKKEGSIVIDLSEADGFIVLNYEDNGLGLPEGFNPETNDSLGFQIIRALVEKLDGFLAFNRENGQQGLSSVLKFPAADL